MESNSNEQTNRERSPWCKCAGVRYLFVVAGFLGMCLVYALRVNMSIAILGMLNNTAISIVTDTHNLTNEPMCALLNPPIHSSKLKLIEVKNGSFVWTPKVQGVIIGSFYYGYVITQVPGARLAEIYSGKWIFGLGIGISALLSLIIPVAAELHTAFLIFVRALQGVAQGVTFPAIYNLLSRWTAEEEKTLIEAVVISGINIGTVLGMPLAAKLTNSDWFGGWPSAFYVIGFIGCVWFVFWILCVTNSPSEHPCITSKELEYMKASQLSEHEPVNGFMSSFPYILQSAVGCLGGFISDEVIKNGLVTPIFARKLCNMLGCLGSIVGLVISSTAGCDITVQITSFGLTMTAGGLWYCSYMITYLDISPEYAGTLIGVASTLSGLTGFITPMIVGALTDTKPTFGQWRIIFAMTIVLLIASAIVYQLFATADKQNWEDEHHTQRSTRYRRYLNRIFRIRNQDTEKDLEKNE
ncbi:Sialin like protein [Argiope bruennichi]|uniref:Sialin like protein n=1 Tax=Argiope bruennichi TaxID=94029 RepID=A0A8T0F9I7_ARGBR|nr:Sialin like protein [Argiope bruennichi]